jgi:hypothetical protein
MKNKLYADDDVHGIFLAHPCNIILLTSYNLQHSKCANLWDGSSLLSLTYDNRISKNVQGYGIFL